MEIKQAIAKLTGLYVEISAIDEQIKEIKSELKEAGHNAAVISAVAKSIADGKTDALSEKSQEVLDVIEISRS
jgi:uncharacterized protein (UPF0335 family)